MMVGRQIRKMCLAVRGGDEIRAKAVVTWIVAKRKLEGRMDRFSLSQAELMRRALCLSRRGNVTVAVQTSQLRAHGGARRGRLVANFHVLLS